MPKRIFIAVENPYSWIGYKEHNRRIDKNGDTAFPKYNINDDDKYKNRRTAVGGFKGISNKDTDKDRDLVLDLTNYPNVDTHFDPNEYKVGMSSCGSLKSMLKDLKNFALKHGKVSTIIFIGHGNESSISLGLGHLSAKDENVAKLIRASSREIGDSNKTEWRDEFLKIKDCVKMDKDHACLNVFLLGCCTGAQRMPENLAQSLNRLLGMSVAVYGLKEESNTKDTRYVLTNLKDILQDCQGKAEDQDPWVKIATTDIRAYVCW